MRDEYERPGEVGRGDQRDHIVDVLLHEVGLWHRRGLLLAVGTGTWPVVGAHSRRPRHHRLGRLGTGNRSGPLDVVIGRGPGRVVGRDHVVPDFGITAQARNDEHRGRARPLAVQEQRAPAANLDGARRYRNRISETAGAPGSDSKHRNQHAEPAPHHNSDAIASTPPPAEQSR